MTRFTVNILPRAEQDFESLYLWIYEQSPSGAASWFNAYQQSLTSLETQPTSHSLAPEDEHHAEEIRQLLFRTPRGKTYRALFTIREDQVYLLHLRGPGQDVMTAEDIQTP